MKENHILDPQYFLLVMAPVMAVTHLAMSRDCPFLRLRQQTRYASHIEKLRKPTDRHRAVLKPDTYDGCNHLPTTAALCS